MEITKLYKTSEIFPIQESSQIGDVRRYVSYLAEELNFTKAEIANLAIVVTEAGTNLLKHTETGGQIIIQAMVENQHTKIEIIVIDQGPGIPQLNLCLQDGYSTAKTQGNGFGAMQRLSDFFDIYTRPQQGTAIFAEIWHKPLENTSSIPLANASIQVGSLCLRMPGESVCGDGWMIISNKAKTSQTLLLCDGLGHGTGAHSATNLALATFQEDFEEDIENLFQSLHSSLRKTRGAAVAIAQINYTQQQLNFAGIGNIEGKLILPAKEHTLLSQNGIVGHAFRQARGLSYALAEKFSFIFYSDGLKNRWELMKNYPGLLAKHPSLIAAVLYRDFQRGRDDTSIVVIKKS